MMLWLVIAAFCAFVDWTAVAAHKPKVEGLAKPSVMVFLILAVAFGDVATPAMLVIAGLSCSLIGDIALLPSIDRFLVGLGAFLVGHLFFIAAFVTGTPTLFVPGLVLGSIVSLVIVLTIGRTIVEGARRQNAALAPPVMAYVVVLATMLTCGFLAGSTVAAAGATLFAASDAVLGWHRFVQPLTRGRLLTHIPYHLGQGLIALWVILL